MYDKYDIQMDGNRMTIDLRELINNGAHPRKDMFELITNAELGTILQVHTPRYPKPLVAGFEELGLNVEVDEIEPGNFKVTTVKHQEIES